MFDGKTLQGGLSDRLRGITAIYQVCKELGVDFKVNFTSPFDLRDVFKPSKVDWSIDPEDVCYNPKDATVAYIMDITYGYSVEKQKRMIARLIAQPYKQIHFYTNADFTLSTNFASLFEELFLPCDALQNEIDSNLKALGAEYNAATFRFQQLLGDFNERADLEVLSPDKAQALIEKCELKVSEYLDQLPAEKKLLVTSDSITFLRRVELLDRVYVIPGELAHLNVQAEDKSVYLKSFVDLYMLMQAEKIVLFKTEQMFDSGFPRLAALSLGTEFELREF